PRPHAGRPRLLSRPLVTVLRLRAPRTWSRADRAWWRGRSDPGDQPRPQREEPGAGPEAQGALSIPDRSRPRGDAALRSLARARRSQGAGRGAAHDGRPPPARRRPLAAARRQHPGASRSPRPPASRSAARLVTDFGASVGGVEEALAAAGGGHKVIALEQSARTSAQAASAVGCQVDQIAKSLVFRGAESQRAVLVIASGANRVDEGRVAALIAEPVGRADADFVRQRTGFAIGGVAPVAHAERLTILIDEDLMRWPEIWAAAGRPNTVFKLTPDDLVRLTGGRVAPIKSIQ